MFQNNHSGVWKLKYFLMFADHAEPFLRSPLVAGSPTEMHQSRIKSDSLPNWLHTFFRLRPVTLILLLLVSLLLPEALRGQAVGLTHKGTPHPPKRIIYSGQVWDQSNFSRVLSFLRWRQTNCKKCRERQNKTWCCNGLWSYLHPRPPFFFKRTSWRRSGGPFLHKHAPRDWWPAHYLFRFSARKHSQTLFGFFLFF